MEEKNIAHPDGAMGGRPLTFSASGKFTCNVCGSVCDRAATPPGREAASCPNCISTVRLRGMVALLSREMFGAALALPHFPELKSIRAFGMSDPPNLAPRLAEKFDYVNTFYHQPPMLDIVDPPPDAIGRYDFIVSSEVMEHVPPPIEHAFANLYRLLKPQGLLLLTVPYSLDPELKEHYPNLHDYALASPGGRTVLINRRRDGQLETFENLCFHGGDGSTLELRVFNEDSLKALLLNAGFDHVHIAAENVPEFGVDHAENWSLPIVARKGRFHPPSAEIAQAYGAAAKQAAHLEQQLAALRADYEKHIEFHARSHEEMKQEMARREEWTRKIERDFEERTAWAQSLEREKNDAIAHFNRVQGEAAEAWARIEALEAELNATRSALAAFEQRKWTRLGRTLGVVR